MKVRKILSILLALCLCAGLISLPAQAAVGDEVAAVPPAQVTADGPHTHAPCGDANCTGHPEGEDGAAAPLAAVEYTPVTSEDDFVNLTPTKAYITISGNYYLNDNVVLTKEIRSSGETNLCLNGYTLTSEAASVPAALVIVGGQFSIADCSDSGTGKIISTGSKTFAGVIHVQNAKLALYGGALSGGDDPNANAGGIQLGDASTFDMYGGSILDSNGNTGAGVLVINQGNAAQPSVFNLYGGSISGNGDENAHGGGVTLYANAVLNQYGGSIEGNAAEMGGGVFIGVLDTPAVYNLYGGKVSGNTAKTQDGGVHLNLSGANNFHFNMYGGELSGNHSDGMSGGVGASGDMKLYGGSIINNTSDGSGGGLVVSNYVHIKGAPSIQGNTQNGQPSNIYNGNWDNTVLVLDGPLDDRDEKMGVQIAVSKTGTFTSGWPAHMSGKNPADYFTSDIAGYVIDLDNSGEAQVRQAQSCVVTVTPTENGSYSVFDVDGSNPGTALTSGASVLEGHAMKISAAPASGYQLDSATVTKSDNPTQIVTTTSSGEDDFDFIMPAFDVTVTVTFEKKPESSGGGSPAPTYPPMIRQPENGSVSTSPKNPGFGQAVTVTAEAEEGFVVDEIRITDQNGETIAVRNNGDGTYSFTQPRGKVNIEVVFKAEACDGGEDCPSKHLADVDKTAWYHQAVDYVVVNGLMQGLEKTIFAPDGITTRGQLVTILWRLEKQPTVNYAMTFEDVEAEAWYAEAVRWATSERIVEGYCETAFGADDAVTREQFAAILWRYAAYKGYDVSASADVGAFTDHSGISAYALPAMQWAVAEGLLEGVGDLTLAPRGNAVRAQTAAILMRFCEDITG